MIEEVLTQSRRGTKGGGDCGPAVLRGFVPSCESGPFSITGSGTHTIRWKYIKGSSGSAGSDCLWIDNVRWSGAMPDVNEIEYVYDPSGRRIEKKVDGDTQLKFLYDGDHILAEYDANDTLLRKYVHGPCIDEPICMIESSGTYAGTHYYHYDALGSVVALTDPNGDVVQLYEYSIYGQVAASDANHPNRFMFTGREFDKDTGLYYYRARYYNPEIGRFLQTDPAGCGGRGNLYRYCRDNPLYWIDPSGRQPTVERIPASNCRGYDLKWTRNPPGLFPPVVTPVGLALAGPYFKQYHENSCVAATILNALVTYGDWPRDLGGNVSCQFSSCETDPDAEQWIIAQLEKASYGQYDPKVWGGKMWQAKQVLPPDWEFKAEAPTYGEILLWLNQGRAVMVGIDLNSGKGEPSSPLKNSQNGGLRSRDMPNTPWETTSPL